MTDNNRIAALRAKAEGMGLYVGPTGKLIKPKGGTGFRVASGIVESQGKGTWVFYGNHTKDDLATAATLLNALDPEAVGVEIRTAPDSVEYCYYRCSFFNSCPWQIIGERGDKQTSKHCPGPAQPGHKWILVEVPECPS